MKCLKKKISLLVVSFFIVEAFAYSPFKIDLNIEFGALKGEINEYVIYTAPDESQYFLSRLDWDVDFIMFGGASADIVFAEHIYIGLGGRIGFPGSSGYMQDYDWKNVLINYDKGWIDSHGEDWLDSHNWLTNYSKHNNSLSRYLDGSLKFGGIINLPWKIFLLPSVSIQAQEFSFDGLDGYLQYPNNGFKNADGFYNSWNDELDTESCSGKVISYTQQRLFFNVGLRLYTTIIPHFMIAVEGSFSPLVKISALDNHWLKEVDFLDQTSGMGAWTISGEVQYLFKKLFKIGATVDYQYVPILLGNDYYKNTTDIKWFLETDCLGGTASNILSFSLQGTLFF